MNAFVVGSLFLLHSADALATTLAPGVHVACYSPHRHHAGAATPSPSSMPRRSASDTKLAAIRSATFGMGCFWAPSESLLKREGVLETTAGYTGVKDSKGPPTYDSVCYGRDWVEGVRLSFDDSVVSYEELLEDFFENNKSVSGSRQYGSFIFPTDGGQEAVARKWLEAGIESRRKNNDNLEIRYTKIEKPTKFFKAEEYHQNYWPKLRVRIAVGVSLLALSSGLGKVVPEYESQLETCTSALFLVGVVLTFLERKLDKTVVEM